MPRILVLIAFTLFFANCAMPECKNTNPIFDQYAIDSREYKTELVKQLNLVPADKLSYWIDEYMEKDGRIYMSVYIKGHGLCAKGMFDITHDNSLQYYKKTRGTGYRGAELREIQYTIDSAHGELNLICTNAGYIVD